MINGIEIHGFKRFTQEQFDLAPLTLLTGRNGVGKTSLVHALLLAWEASSSASSTVRLNGPFGMELGTAEDVRNWNVDDHVQLVLSSDECEDATWKLEIPVPADDALYLSVAQRPNRVPNAFAKQARAFCYLAAERLGPRSVLGASPHPAEDLEIGVRGEYCAQVVEALGNKPLTDERRLHPDKDVAGPSLLKYEVEHWLSEISRPIEIDALHYPGTAVTALRFRSPGGDWVRAPNMGFGVSYALPVILAGLTCAAGGMLVVENPEAHLHPAGQSRMGTFLAWLAGRGIQVVVETHSDHVLNGVRRAIGERQFLGSDSALAYYFDSAEDNDIAIEKLKFTSIGGISHWPKGFFDQYQLDVASLGRLRRRG